MDTNALRAAFKAKRNQIPRGSIANLSIEINAKLWRLNVLARSQRIACYLPVGAEVDCRFAARIAWDRKRDVFLPVIRDEELVFAPYRPDSQFLRNRYGIPEPICISGNFFRPSEMDVVLAPLVAFDKRGNRVGMGAGYYDRSFRFMQNRNQWQRPHLIGLAYELQKAAKIKASSWDIPLSHAVTEKHVYTFR